MPTSFHPRCIPHAPFFLLVDTSLFRCTQLDQLSSEVEQLRGAIRAFEAALADYKAQRAPFAALSGALERGQRTADRCSSLQVQIEVGRDRRGNWGRGGCGITCTVFCDNLS